MRLIQYNSVFIFKPQIEFVPFKIVPLGGYTSPETLFPLFVAALEVANWNRFPLVGYSFFDVFYRPKMVYFNPSAWGHLNPSSYCDVGRLFYGVFKLWSKLQRKK